MILPILKASKELCGIPNMGHNLSAIIMLDRCEEMYENSPFTDLNREVIINQLEVTVNFVDAPAFSYPDGTGGFCASHRFLNIEELKIWILDSQNKGASVYLYNIRKNNCDKLSIWARIARHI